jgi:membrane protein
MCLFKHQGAYFIFPILLYTCILKIDIYKKIKGFMMGLFIGIMGWLPFIWLYKDILYPIRFMLHMMSENSVISMAINPWFLIQVIRLYETDVLFKFANVFILLCVVLLLITYIKSKDIVISTYIYMLSIYMFSLGQRERYILYSLIIAYYICYIIRDTSYLKIYKAFRVSAIISLSFFLINTISPKDVAYYSLYIILPLYFLLAVWLLIKTANIYNLIFSKPKV